MSGTEAAGPSGGVIDSRVRIGHTHLKVADLDRALAFYVGVLGFEIQQIWHGQAAFVSGGGYHHHIGLNTWYSSGGSPPPPGATGLFHHAFSIPRGPRWRMPHGASSMRESAWTAHRTTV